MSYLKMSRKRRHSVVNKLDINIKLEKSDDHDSLKSVKQLKSTADEHCFESKRLCKEDDIYSDWTSECKIYCASHSICKDNINRYYPYNLIRFTYKLALLVFCMVRTLIYNYNFTFSFEDDQIDRFNSIVVYNGSKSVHIQVENVDTYITGNYICYNNLFSKTDLMFSLSSYFNSFAKYVLSASETSVNNIQYLIIYTNGSLDITDDYVLKRGRIKEYYPYKFIVLDVETCDILRDLLVINSQKEAHGFYQFSQDNVTVTEISKFLKFSAACRKLLDASENPEELESQIKAKFLEKLVFAVDQPSREALNSITKNQLNGNNTIEHKTLESSNLVRPGNHGRHKNITNFAPAIIRELSLLMLFMHEMFLHEEIYFINFYLCNNSLFSDILVHFKKEVIYLKATNVNCDDGFSHLFSNSKKKNNSLFSLNDCFTLFVQSLNSEVKYFIIYTSEELKLTNDGRSKEIQSLKFVKADVENKEFKILKGCSCINTNHLYQFAEDKDTKAKVFSLLNLQNCVKNTDYSDEHEMLLKQTFLNRLIFAVNQPDIDKLYKKINSDIKKHKVPYIFEELHEVTLRWLESHDLGPITKTKMRTILSDVKADKLKSQEICVENIEEKKRFARTVVGRESNPAFNEFLHFLTKGKGIRCLEVLKDNGIKISNMSSILRRAGNKAVDAFKDLYDLWIDADERKSKYLKNLEREEISLVSMCSMLGNAGAQSKQSFIDLYNIFIDDEGKATECLRILQENKIKLSSMSSILNRSGPYAAEAFKNLFTTLFKKENKIYLKALKKEGIDFTNLSNILNGSGRYGYKVFMDLYYTFFDKSGNKTQYSKTLEKEGINLSTISSIIRGTNHNAVKCFKNLYQLFFDEAGNKTLYLKSLDREGIGLSTISSILSGSRSNAARAFLELYNILFDDQGIAKPCLKTLKKNGLHLCDVSSILSNAGSNAAKTFQQLYSLLFKADGSKTESLVLLENEGISLSNISSILHAAGRNAPKAFLNLCNTLFDESGLPTKYVENFKRNGVSSVNLSSILSGAREHASEAMKELHDLWFDNENNKSHYILDFENKGISLDNISSILGMSGNKAGKAFMDLYSTFFNEKGKRKTYLKHFVSGNETERFKMDNLSSILCHSGANAKEAFLKLHDTFYNQDGSKTKLLEDFFNAGFKPSHLSCLLSASGVHASILIERFHSRCFNKQREKTDMLLDFLQHGFEPNDICNLLNGSPDNFPVVHKFCFKAKTKVYLEHFITRNEFSVKQLCTILLGARTSFCFALKEFHDVCYDDSGERTKLLNDFCKAGFTFSHLTSILSMSGGFNASLVLKKFHSVCFSQKNYLNHFLNEDTVFTPCKLTKILHGTGMCVRQTFKKLHHICFDKAGKRTDYFQNLLKNNECDIIDILYKKVRNSSRTS